MVEQTLAEQELNSDNNIHLIPYNDIELQSLY
jgi:hypothetical protein